MQIGLGYERLRREALNDMKQAAWKDTLKLSEMFLPKRHRLCKRVH